LRCSKALRKERKMVQFVLPPDSKVCPGKRYEPLSKKPFKRFHIYRYDPETKKNPWIDSKGFVGLAP